MTDALGRMTSAGYDDAGNVTSITDPNGHTTRFEFDKSNRRTQRTDANGHVWLTEYDKAGNLTKSTAPGGLVTSHVYDSAGHLTKTTLPDLQQISYSYDSAGNRVSMTDSSGTTAYAYDGIRRLTQVTDGQGKVLKYAYDAGGNRSAITYPHNKVVSYAFDAAERLVKVTDWLNKNYSYSLNAAGQVTALTMGNGATATMVYDAASRLSSLVNKQPNGTVISSHALQMDPNGNITSAAVQLPLLPSFGNTSKAMTYDLANRLATVDGAAVTHDDAGRPTAIGGEGYAYDGRDLLTTITGPNAGSYSYNGAGHRVARTVGAATTRYVVDPNAELPNVVAETDGAGGLLRSYVYGYGLLAQISVADVARYYHFDQTGHTVALSEVGGSITDRYAYTPYGEVTALGSTVNPFRFVGKHGVMNDANGIYYMRARYYNPNIGRFVGPDSIEGLEYIPASLNRYVYGDSNPQNKIDPTGLFSEPRIDNAASEKMFFLVVLDPYIRARPFQDKDRVFEDGASLLKEFRISGWHGIAGNYARDVLCGMATEVSVAVDRGQSNLNDSEFASNICGALKFADPMRAQAAAIHDYFNLIMTWRKEGFMAALQNEPIVSIDIERFEESIGQSAYYKSLPEDITTHTKHNPSAGIIISLLDKTAGSLYRLIKRINK